MGCYFNLFLKRLLPSSYNLLNHSHSLRFISVLTDDETDDDDQLFKERKRASIRSLPVRWKIVLGDRAIIMTGRDRGKFNKVIQMNELTGYFRIRGCLLVSLNK